VAVGDTVPQGAGEHETDQLTPRLFGSFTTVAVNLDDPAAWIVAELGSTATVVPGTVIVARFETVLAATDVATTETVRSPAGKVVGAV
jgi:hypothetical protein